MNVLVTGSSGFIGSALCKGLKETYPKITIFKFEMRDIQQMQDWRATLETYVKLSSCIFHIGAISSTDAADINSVLFLNYEFSKILFDLAAKHNKHVVYSSSAATYGKGDNIPSTLYAWSKKMAEDYGLLVVPQFVSLRYFNVYGPDESHKGHMASVAFQAWKHSQTTKQPFQLLPGYPKRDFVYVKDVVRANIYGWRQTPGSGVYDVGTGVAQPFEDVLNTLKIPFVYKGEENIPPWYQYFTQADENKFLPGWQPQYSLTQGLIDYLSYLN